MTDRCGENGFTLLEVVIGMALIVIGLFGLFAAIASAAKVRQNSTETELVSRAAAAMIENVRATAFPQVTPTFAPPNDLFEVPGLSPAPGDTAVGRITFYFNEATIPETLGGPRDLNANGNVTDTDVSGAGPAPLFKILPIEVTLRWQGVAGTRETHFYALITR